MDIKLKMGAKTSLPSTVDKGTVYFAKDGDKNFGELYYGDENGNKVKIGGTNISSAYFGYYDEPDHQDLYLFIKMEDGTEIGPAIPEASPRCNGLLSASRQQIGGQKIFLDPITFEKDEYEHSIAPSDDGLGLTITGECYAILKSGSCDSHLTVDEGTIVLHAAFAEDAKSLILDCCDGFWTDTIGCDSNYIPTAFIEEITADSIHSTMFTGAFTGDLEGNAKTATSWYAPITLNGTEVKGGETAAITTAKWGAARNFSISDSAGTTGTSIDGSSEDGYTLVIPSTMTGFTSITSTNLLATNLGATGTPVMTSHFKEVYLHNPNNNNYMHKLTSNAGSATCDLQLPNTSGLLLSKPTTNTAVGDTNSPVYIAASGEATVCTTIAVDHGGTGLNTVAAGSLVYGNGINAMGTIAADAKGKLLGSNGASTAPIYLTPSLSFTTGTSNPKVKLTINGVDYETSTGIQAASSTNPGIVSVGTQTFNGAKTFSEAATFSKGLSSTTGTFSGQINANADIKLKGSLKSDSSGTSFVTLTDTRATITSPALHLNGTILVLNSSTYGTDFPQTGLEEGRVFFLLT